MVQDDFLGAIRSPARSDPEERALLERIVHRDRPAFEALYRQYYRRLTRFLDRLIRQPDVIEEVLNDVMFAVWTRASTYNQESRVSTWIFAIAYRQALKRLRDQGAPFEELPDQDDIPEDGAGGPEALAMHRQSAERLLAAMENLPVEQRTVVELTYFHGLAYPEIAKIMECPNDTVKTRMFHARRKLRQMLE